MKYAILGDIHANLEALQAVLEDAKKHGAERFFCTGDLVGYNADPRACLRLFRKHKITAVQGNHDYYASSHISAEDFTPVARQSICWTRSKLSYANRKYLSCLPSVLEKPHFTLVHGSLADPSDWLYVSDVVAARLHFRNQFCDLCFMGHTHIPQRFIQQDGTVRKESWRDQQMQPGVQYLINVGSVGQPRDYDPRAAYVLYDSTEQTIQLRRVEYDIAKTQQKIRDAGLPFRNALRLEEGR